MNNDNQDALNSVLDINLCSDDIEVTCDRFGDAWTEITFPDVPSILDTDDLKVNGLMCPTMSVYQFLYVGIFFALFYTNFINESSVLFLAPNTDQTKSKYCKETPISITSAYWIDEKGYFEGDINYDSSHTIYRLEMKNMKLTLDEYQSMIDYFENEYKIIAARTEQRDATFSFLAYTSCNIRYYPKSGGTVDFYLSGDSSVAFDSIYEGANTFFVSNNDVCVPSNLEINFDKSKSSIVTNFQTYHELPYVQGEPTISPTAAINTFRLDYVSNQYKADVVTITLCDQGHYSLGDCDCSGDQKLYLYDSNNTRVAYSDDNCGPLNYCSLINYEYTFSSTQNPPPSCSTFQLLMGTYNGGEVRGKMNIVGPGLTSTSYKVEDSLIFCRGNTTHSCTLTCPNSNQDITDIHYAFYGAGSYVIPNGWPSWQQTANSAALAANSAASASLRQSAESSCISQNSCTVNVDPNVVFVPCSNDDYYMDYIYEGLIISIQAKCRKVRRRQLDLGYESSQDLHRRLGDSKDAKAKPNLIQSCKNDISKEFVLEIGTDSAGDIGFYDNGEKATSSVDMRSAATVMAINLKLVKTDLLTRTASFTDLIAKLNVTEYSSQLQLNFKQLIEMDMAFYSDPFYEGMDPILCGKFAVNGHKVELCALVVAGTVAIPILTSEGINDKSYYEEIDSDLKKKRCLFQTGKLRCDRFSYPDCELDHVNKYDFDGFGYNHYYFGLIYISNNDLRNNEVFGEYLEWVDILLRFMKNDIDNYDDNFQSAAYNIMATYNYIQLFQDIKSNNGHYDHNAHSQAVNTTFYSYFNSPYYSAYPSNQCPANYRTLLQNGLRELCGDAICKMMVIPYRNQDDAFSFFLGSYVGVGTNRFKAGDKSTYGSQLFREEIFKKVRDSPPSQLVSEVLICRQNPTNIFVNSIGVTYSNSQLILSIVFTLFAAALVKIWNKRKGKPKVYSVTMKNYLYKQTLAAAFNCIHDRMKVLEEKLLEDDNQEYSLLYKNILDVIDLVDQVDDIDPQVLISQIKGMNLSEPVTKLKREKLEYRERKRSLKLSRSGKFMSVAPLPPDIQHSINRDDDNDCNNNDDEENDDNKNHHHHHHHHHHQHHPEHHQHHDNENTP